jgi:2-polyprenyl-3-methyl-5-hydroxy-6-metoxy-1,4-benzoquinol methylase
MYFKTSGGFICNSAYFAQMQPQGSFKELIPAFSQKLSAIIAANLVIEDYCKRYLEHLLLHQGYYLTIYAHVLDEAMKHMKQLPSQVNLVDFGAGNGLLGMFAKFCGFQKVFLCDVDADFIKAAEVLSKSTNIIIDGFITGDLETLQHVLQNEKVDVMAGTDVIEHIYNLDDFFAGVKSMNENMVTVFTTASNPQNFIKVKKLKKLQVSDETVGGDPADFVLAGAEKHEAFALMREKIIVAAFPAMAIGTAKQLAILTRGLKENDIVAAVRQYLHSKQLPVIQAIGTNTCHPITGSWTERILPIAAYKNIYEKQGFVLQVHNGFYNAYSRGARKYFNFFMNFLVRLTGKIAAPFITLVGYKYR